MARIIESIAHYATVRRSDDPDVLYLDTLEGEELRPPAVVRAPQRAVERWVRSAGEESGLVFSDVSADERGMRLLSIDLDGLITTRVVAGSTVVITDDDIVVENGGHPQQITFEQGENWDPDGEYYWSAERPG